MQGVKDGTCCKGSPGGCGGTNTGDREGLRLFNPTYFLLKCCVNILFDDITSWEGTMVTEQLIDGGVLVLTQI